MIDFGNRYRILLILLMIGLIIAPVTAATTELRVIKYAADETTIINETVVDYEWMEANLPVLGDGETSYFHQGPVFDGDPWNPGEDVNLRDQGAVKGTDLADICDLAGGMSDGETVRVRAFDGFSKDFPYNNVYNPESRQGPIGITWYRAGDGYVPDFSDGMMLVFFADDTVFGVNDMRETFPEEYWHYFDIYPTTTGLSVKYISEIRIMSNEEAPPDDETDILFDGTMELSDESVNVRATSGESYEISRLTPLGALEATGFPLTINDRAISSRGILLLDGIEDYLYERPDDGPTRTWECAVNGYTLDDWGNSANDGLNIYSLEDGDIVEFFYGVRPLSFETAEAYIRMEISVDEPPAEDWILTLKGAREEIIHRTYFEAGTDCQTNPHVATYTDDDGNVWSGMPLWWLVGYVDDENSHGSDAFNDELAAQGYSVKVIAGDGYSINFQSATVARNDNIIVANTLNGEPLPATIGEKAKPCFPLQLVGSDVSSGQKIGNIVTIELIGLPVPTTEWTITLNGAYSRSFSQSEFEEGVACGHAGMYTDTQDQVWTGMPLWYLLAVVDDYNGANHWRFNDERASGYTVTITAQDGFSREFNGADIARSDGFIVANMMNAAPLAEDNGFPLRLQGSALTSGGQRIGSIASITINGLPEEPAEDEWVLTLKGDKISARISESSFTEMAETMSETWSDGEDIWTGIPLWRLAGIVDDDLMTGTNAFNEGLATDGYTIIVSSGGASPYSKDFTSQNIANNKNDYIVAYLLNGEPIEGNSYPLRLVGEGATGSLSVGNIETIELTAFEPPTEAPSIRIVRYAADGVTVLDDVTKDYLWMKENLHVYGGEDGVQLRFQGPTFDPDDLWNPAEDKNPNKVDEVVRGTSIKDLVDLVGGAPEGSEIILRASDGYVMKLDDTNLNSPLERQGEAIVAWWTERQGYVPDYKDGYRLFFNTPDGIFGADDMRATLKEEYWHYFWSGGIQYPSAAGCSNKNIVTIEIHTGTREDWTLRLTGAITDTIERAYFEAGKACAMAGDSHLATWIDNDGNEWSGMPLWTLVGWVDDENKHDYGSDPFRDDLAVAGYDVTVIDYGPDGVKGTEDDFSATFHSTVVARNNNIIVADEINGQPLSDQYWPLRLVGSDLTSGRQRVGSIDEIEITFPEPVSGDAVIHLKEGWNFISVPKRLDSGNNTASIFAEVDTGDHSIFEYDAVFKTWKALGETDLITPLKGYWIYSTQGKEIPLTFMNQPLMTPPTIELQKGWNAVGFTDIEPATARDTFLSLGDAWTQTIGYDAGEQRYATAIIREGSGSYSDGRLLYPTNGYWIYLKSSGELAAIST
ncbi:molybdopterin-dependent oxidoreductase [Methanocalculus chunghsingensis]|uniref:molybdopterin-dependent oxidoreductase n=1 Tax=Methanocalculus chunghsingensis TaxID=156457 RepID=UPI001B8B13EA|nr:molybdopterin-dependent oxidoreductase [Methanocalculus chunghsingensis]